MSKTALLLINVGTPDSPDVKSVRRYLSAFLNDPKVIDIPWLLRKILVNLIIVPFRAPKSAKLYQRLWTGNGSPLLFYANSLKVKLQEELADKAIVFVAMRYGNPNIADVLKQIQSGGFSKVVVMPLFPQYASSTTETSIKSVQDNLLKIDFKPEIEIVKQFYNHPVFISAFVKKIREADFKNYDHVIFSYHGLPVSHINKIHPQIKENSCSCAEKMPGHGTFCYKATCYETTRLLVHELALPKEKYSVSFQSRLSKNWLKPFTDQTIRELAKAGKKRILVVAPAFVSDCLETTIEIGEEYRELFLQCGGEELKLVESLNDSGDWVEAINLIARKSF